MCRLVGLIQFKQKTTTTIDDMEYRYVGSNNNTCYIQQHRTTTARVQWVTFI